MLIRGRGGGNGVRSGARGGRRGLHTCRHLPAARPDEDERGDHARDDRRPDALLEAVPDLSGGRHTAPAAALRERDDRHARGAEAAEEAAARGMRGEGARGGGARRRTLEVEEGLHETRLRHVGPKTMEDETELPCEAHLGGGGDGAADEGDAQRRVEEADALDLPHARGYGTARQHEERVSSSV